MSNLEFFKRRVQEQEAAKSKRHAAMIERQEKGWMLDYKRREALDHAIVEKENYRSMLQYAKQLGIQTRLQSHKERYEHEFARAALSFKKRDKLNRKSFEMLNIALGNISRTPKKKRPRRRPRTASRPDEKPMLPGYWRMPISLFGMSHEAGQVRLVDGAVSAELEYAISCGEIDVAYQTPQLSEEVLQRLVEGSYASLLLRFPSGEGSNPEGITKYLINRGTVGVAPVRDSVLYFVPPSDLCFEHLNQLGWTVVGADHMLVLIQTAASPTTREQQLSLSRQNSKLEFEEADAVGDQNNLNSPPPMRMDFF